MSMTYPVKKSITLQNLCEEKCRDGYKSKRVFQRKI